MEGLGMLGGPTGGGNRGRAYATPPQVVLGTKNPFPAMPSESQRYFFTDPDADINAVPGGDGGFPGSLLGAEDGNHFAYGAPNRLGTQSAYGPPIPHTAVVRCPSIRVPRPLPLPGRAAHLESSRDKDLTSEVPHPCLSVNELAFSMRMVGARGMATLVPSSVRNAMRGEVDWAYGQPVVNLEVVNYVLAGLQRHLDSPGPWRTVVWEGLGLDSYFGAGAAEGIRALPRGHPSREASIEAICTHVVRSCIRPLGVVVACEFHANSEAVSVVVDGEVRNLQGMWAVAGQRYPAAGGPGVGSKRGRSGGAVGERDFIEPGESLSLILRRVPTGHPDLRGGGGGAVDGCAVEAPATVSFHLPRASSAREVLRFTGMPSGTMWQLVPSVHSPLERECWERLGFWHVGVVRGEGVAVYGPGESGRSLGRLECEEWMDRHRPLHVTLAPTWVEGGHSRGDDWGGALALGAGGATSTPSSGSASPPLPPPTPPMSPKSAYKKHAEGVTVLHGLNEGNGLPKGGKIDPAEARQALEVGNALLRDAAELRDNNPPQGGGKEWEMSVGAIMVGVVSVLDWKKNRVDDKFRKRSRWESEDAYEEFMEELEGIPYAAAEMLAPHVEFAVQFIEGVMVDIIEADPGGDVSRFVSEGARAMDLAGQAIDLLKPRRLGVSGGLVYPGIQNLKWMVECVCARWSIPVIIPAPLMSGDVELERYQADRMRRCNRWRERVVEMEAAVFESWHENRAPGETFGPVIDAMGSINVSLGLCASFADESWSHISHKLSAGYPERERLARESRDMVEAIMNDIKSVDGHRGEIEAWEAENTQAATEGAPLAPPQSRLAALVADRLRNRRGGGEPAIAIISALDGSRVERVGPGRPIGRSHRPPSRLVRQVLDRLRHMSDREEQGI